MESLMNQKGYCSAKGIRIYVQNSEVETVINVERQKGKVNSVSSTKQELESQNSFAKRRMVSFILQKVRGKVILTRDRTGTSSKTGMIVV